MKARSYRARGRWGVGHTKNTKRGLGFHGDHDRDDDDRDSDDDDARQAIVERACKTRMRPAEARPSPYLLLSRLSAAAMRR